MILSISVTWFFYNAALTMSKEKDWEQIGAQSIKQIPF